MMDSVDWDPLLANQLTALWLFDTTCCNLHLRLHTFQELAYHKEWFYQCLDIDGILLRCRDSITSFIPQVEEFLKCEHHDDHSNRSRILNDGSICEFA
jgi:hypothetical protein